MTTPILHRLYLRIWLAVVGTILVLTLLAAWLARMEAEHERGERPEREIVLRNDAGQIIAQAPARPVRIPGQGPEFQVRLADGSHLFIQLPRPVRRPPGEASMGGGRPPFNFGWMLGLVALAVALGTYPIARRLTQRLEAVDAGVRKWGEGDLSQRVPQDGKDEVAALARGFNAAAERVEGLLLSHKALLANASHELRSPLARIRMGLELMEGQADHPARQEIARNIQELDQLVDEILLASRLDVRTADLGTVEPVDLLGLVAEEAARSGAELTTITPGSAMVIQGVPKLLRRMVRNLLENAHRHGASRVHASLWSDGAEVVLAVDDDGPGVPVALRQRIFEPFFRIPGASERDGGVGLGLALVQSITRRHGGVVACVETDRPGARFEVRLPVEGASRA